MKVTLIASVVIAGLALSACGWMPSGNVDAAAPSPHDNEVSLPKSTVKGSTSGNLGLLTADQADQWAQDRCMELGMERSPDPQMRKESDPMFMTWKMPGIARSVPCEGERQGGTRCSGHQFNHFAFQRANVTGEAGVLRCNFGGDGGFVWLPIEAYPSSE